MASNAKITATLNMDTGEWTRALTRGKDQLRAFQMGISNIKLRKIPMPEIETPRAGGFGRMQHMQGQWENFRRNTLHGVEKGSVGASMGMLELTRAFEDFSMAGMKGAINNLPGMIQGFGGSAGLAGAVSFVAVSFYSLGKAYDYWKTASEGDKEAELAAEQRKLAAAVAETKRRVDESIASYRKLRGEGLSDREQKGMQWLERQFTASERVKSAEENLEDARTGQAETLAELAAENERRFAREEAALTRQIDYLQQLQDLETKRLAESRQRIAAMQQEYEGLKRISQTTVGSDGTRQVRTEISPVDAQRGRELEGRMEIERARMQELENRADAAFRNREGAVQERDRVLPLNREAARADVERQRMEQEKQRMQEQRQRFDEWGDAMREATQQTLRELKARRDKEAAERAAQQATREDSEIAGLRARGRGAAADRRERAVQERRREEQLRQEGFSPEEAAQIARRESRDRSGRSGQRIGGDTRPSGLDAFDFKPRNLRPETPNLDEMRQRKNSALPKVADNTGKGDSIGDMVAALKSGLATVVSKLEELKNSNAAPVADKIKPANQ